MYRKDGKDGQALWVSYGIPTVKLALALALCVCMRMCVCVCLWFPVGVPSAEYRRRVQ